jgi:hypothetical protein
MIYTASIKKVASDMNCLFLFSCPATAQHSNSLHLVSLLLESIHLQKGHHERNTEYKRQNGMRKVIKEKKKGNVG